MFYYKKFIKENICSLITVKYPVVSEKKIYFVIYEAEIFLKLKETRKKELYEAKSEGNETRGNIAKG